VFLVLFKFDSEVSEFLSALKLSAQCSWSGFSDFQEFYSSGLGVSDLLALTYGDVKEEFETRYYA
jgi:hypothetical protein